MLTKDSLLGEERGALLTVPEKQRVVAQLELYRKSLLKGNTLRKQGRHSTVLIKDLRQDPMNTSQFFKL